MDRVELLEKLSTFLNEAMMGRAEGIQPDEDLRAKGLDSMGAVDFATMIEEEYGLEEFDPEEVFNLQNLNDAADLVLSKIDG